MRQAVEGPVPLLPGDLEKCGQAVLFLEYWYDMNIEENHGPKKAKRGLAMREFL